MDYRFHFSDPSLDRVMDCQDEEAANAMALLVATNYGVKLISVTPDWNYIGLMLDEESVNAVWRSVDLEFLRCRKVSALHMTMMHHSQYDRKVYGEIQELLGKFVCFVVNRIGFSDKAIALQVPAELCEGVVMNAVPHITLATIGDGKPVDANNIVTWVPLKRPVLIAGEIKIIK